VGFTTYEAETNGKGSPQIEEAIASANFPQDTPTMVSQVVASSEDAIARSSPQSQTVSGGNTVNLGVEQAIANNFPKTQNAPIRPVPPSSEKSSPGFDSAKPQPKAVKKPSQDEINVVCDALKYLGVNPEPCMAVIHKYWHNVQSALDRVREGLQQGWSKNPTGLFIKSCKEGLKPQIQAINNTVKEWFEWARSKRIVIAMSGDVAYTPDGEPVSLQEMMAMYPMR